MRSKFYGDVKIFSAPSWNTPSTLAEFTKTTQLAWPDYLKPLVNNNGVLQIPANGEFIHTLRGVHAKVSVLWKLFFTSSHTGSPGMP